MKKKIYLTGIPFLIILFITVKVSAQEELDQLLAGKNTLTEIMHVVDAYYANRPETKTEEREFESDYQQWKRWEWYMSGRLGPNGEFVNIPKWLMNATEEKNRMESFAQDRNINSSWTAMGPSSSPLQNPQAVYNGLGRVSRITFHPTNSNIIYLCTPAGGLWNTTNGGSSWTNLTDYLPSIGLSGCVISYADPTVLYILTGDGDESFHRLGYTRQSIGVLKSVDGGLSWHQTGLLPDTGDTYFGFALEQSPSDPEILIAATSSGLYRTTDGGYTWTREVSGFCWDVKFKPGDGTRVYATFGGRAFFISTDSGANWTSNSTYDVNPNTCVGYGGDRMMIAVAPTGPSRVYLLSAPRITDGSFCGVWLSTDSGISFTLKSTTPNIFGREDDGSDDADQSDYDLAFTCRSDLSTTIFAAGCTIWKSTNSGVSWTHVTSYGENGAYSYIHPDIHCLAYNPLNNYLYAATDGGFYRSIDHGVNWTNLTNAISTSQFYHMTGWDGNANKLLGGLQDNGIKYRKDNSSAFSHLDGGDGFDIVFNPLNGEPAYSTINTIVAKYSGNGAHSIQCTSMPNVQYFKTLVMNIADSSMVLCGAGNGIYRSQNGGTTWINEGGKGSWTLASCPSNSTRFYGAGSSNYEPNPGGGLYFSNNTGDSWTIKSFNPGFPDTSLWRRINDIAVRPTVSSTVYACFGGFTNNVKVVMSNNTGDTWTNISLNLPNVPVNTLAVDTDNGVYAGTDIGVFYKSATMSLWMPWSNGLPNVPVTDLVIYDDGSIRRLRAATYGRGVWQSTLPQVCDPTVIVNGNVTGIKHYEASSSVTANSVVQGGLGTFVSFQAGSFITLQEGFRVKDESEFLGFISPCGQGGIPGAQEEIPINRSDPQSSIILLHRMWNPKTGMPYGNIRNIDVQSANAAITYDVASQGYVEILLVKQIQEKPSVIYSGTAEGGLHQVAFDISQVPDDFYYVLLFYNGKLAHYQELIK